MLICFTGIDGSGKSFQAQRLVEQLNAAGHPTIYIWSGGRSSLTRPIIRFGKRILKGPKKSQLTKAADSETRAQYEAYLASTQKLFRNRLIRNIWLNAALLDQTAEIWATILPHLLRNRIVVCDRYIYDFIIRAAIMTGMDTEEFRQHLRLPVFCRVPQPSMWFFLDVPAEVAFNRKDDILDIEFLERRVPLYKIMASHFQVEVVDGTAPPDEITAVIWQSIQPLLLKKNEPMLGSEHFDSQQT
jgi:thymidylate kinase